MGIFMTVSNDYNSDKKKLNKTCEELIHKISMKDRQAFSSLYEKTKPMVYGFALSILRNTQNAEDVMQETYINIYNAAGKYRPQGKPIAWILTITRNLSLMKLNETKKNDLVYDDDSVFIDSNDYVNSITDKMLLNYVMTVLTDEERQIIVLHSLLGFKHKEIAGILSLPISTALSKYHRALSKLKKQIKEEI